MFLLALITALMVLPQADQPQPEDTWHFGHYVLERSYRVEGSDGYRILRDGKEVYSASPAGFGIVSVSHGKEIDAQEPTVTDITGDGVPDLIIETSPRNPGCCFGYSIFSLGTKFQQIADLTGFRSPMTFEDINRDSIYEITGEDWTFASKYASPRIVLSFRNGAYSLAMNFMRKTPPTRAALAVEARKFKSKTPLDFALLAPEVYGRVVDMIYEGNAHSALRFVDLVWPEPGPDSEEFKRELVLDLEQSPFWANVRAANGNAFDAIR